MIQACGYESLSVLGVATAIVRAVMWKGLTQGLSPNATDGVFADASCSTHKHTHIHDKQKNIKYFYLLFGRHG